ncbi:beta-Ala-His dipeptidase isoform X6 [Pan paniscus]|uniref:beta-Ala-His dipeptidase isoform X6 n=1 Tax=Pan paniscus TaxID=9597 RepID=UPI002436D17B|nr:beta-Ala-His dipeptidase isoform X7 [Pan paniscus]
MDPKLGRMAASLLAVLLLLLLERGMFSSPSPPPALLEKVFRYIDLHQDEFVQTLKEWVAIESDSVQPVPRFRQELFRMMAMAADMLQRLGARVASVDMGLQQLPDGQSLPIPPIILAELGSDPTKGTVCFYGHLDVQPADQGDGWLTDPYVLTEVDGKLYGRGATDNKGPVLAWINAVSAFRALEQDLPVNIKFIIEGMEEAGSVALEELVEKEKDRFFSGVDYIVISDNLWISQRKPAITYGTRGNSYFMVEVKCRDQDFHSGTFGGILHEPMADLVALLVFGTEPDMIRDGSTIPIAKMFQEIVHKSVVLIPLGAVDDGEHSQNEKINSSEAEMINIHTRMPFGSPCAKMPRSHFPILLKLLAAVIIALAQCNVNRSQVWLAGFEQVLIPGVPCVIVTTQRVHLARCPDSGFIKTKELQ